MRIAEINGGTVVWLLCVGGAAALFLSIGIYAMRRTEPMWFWIGAAVDARTLTDVRAYNHANGWMWIAYSVPFWLSAALGWKLETLGGILLGLACTVGLALVLPADPEAVQQTVIKTKGQGLVKRRGEQCAYSWRSCWWTSCSWGSIW